MNISIVLFIIIFVVFLVTGFIIGLILKEQGTWEQRILKALLVVRRYLVKYWYAFVCLGSTTYVLLNFEDCISLTFTNEFNGNNLLFLFWLGIIVQPFFDGFEAFGINLKKQN